MRGELYIDGKDAYTDFGVWITEGGYDGLLPFPELVEPDRNDWPDEDGIEPDLEKPTLKPRELNITFVRSVDGRSAGALVEHLSKSGYHLFRIPSLGREWSLRLIQSPAYEDWDTLEALTLRFAEDRPVRPSPVAIPEGGGRYVPLSEYELDGVPLDRYGVMVTEGRDEIMRSPTVKTNLSRTVLDVDGKIYDAGKVVYNSKEVTLKCCLIDGVLELLRRPVPRLGPAGRAFAVRGLQHRGIPLLLQEDVRLETGEPPGACGGDIQPHAGVHGVPSWRDGLPAGHGGW